MIYIIDFGSQTTHLIKRRILDMGVDAKIINPKNAYRDIKTDKPSGIIFSGGPGRVYKKGSLNINKKILFLDIPILGICYGWQLMAKALGGKVVKGKSEYGPATLNSLDLSDIFHSLPKTSRVFESHGDSVVKIPKSFKVIGTTENVKYAACSNKRKLFGLQFHPEMNHTDFGQVILKNFATKICHEPLKPRTFEISEMINEIKNQAGDNFIIGAISGGTDSMVAGVLSEKALGNKFIPYYVDSGLMRDETCPRIKTKFPKYMKKVRIIKAKSKFLKALKGVTKPEHKRKVIGKLYIDIFENEARKFGKDTLLLQGTTYADFIHSQGSKHSASIKSHHNVGGLPKRMKLKLIEPLKYFYTDEVREIGLKLGIPKTLVYQQPFPGPGHAVRIIGEVTPKRLSQQNQADSIVVQELTKAGWYKKVFQCWSIMSGTKSTGIKGDARYYGEVVVVRVIQSEDRMTADWTRLPYNILSVISTRIVNEVPGISRVCYDITTKPPATMEWE